MSKILRRPMFRGGPVDSRGTGITTGLDQPRIGAANGRFISGADLLSAAQSFPQLNMFKNIKFNPQSKYVLGQDEDIDRIASFAGEGMDPGFQDLAFADTFNISAPEPPNTPNTCLLYTSPSPRDRTRSRMPSSA